MGKENAYSDEQLMELREKYELPPEDEGSPMQRAVDRIDVMRAEWQESINHSIQEIERYQQATKNGIEGSGYGPRFGESLLHSLSYQISQHEKLNRERAEVLSGARAPDEYIATNHRPSIDDMVKEIVDKAIEKKIGRI